METVAHMSGEKPGPLEEKRAAVAAADRVPDAHFRQSSYLFISESQAFSGFFEDAVATTKKITEKENAGHSPANTEFEARCGIIAIRALATGDSGGAQQEFEALGKEFTGKINGAREVNFAIRARAEAAAKAGLSEEAHRWLEYLGYDGMATWKVAVAEATTGQLQKSRETAAKIDPDRDKIYSEYAYRDIAVAHAEAALHPEVIAAQAGTALLPGQSASTAIVLASQAAQLARFMPGRR